MEEQNKHQPTNINMFNSVEFSDPNNCSASSNSRIANALLRNAIPGPAKFTMSTNVTFWFTRFEMFAKQHPKNLKQQQANIRKLYKHQYNTQNKQYKQYKHKFDTYK